MTTQKLQLAGPQGLSTLKTFVDSHQLPWAQ
jgi:hypothetical protein